MKKKILSLLTMMCMVTTLLPANVAFAATSGICGDNLNWTLDNGGTLTISGTGGMKDYEYKGTPWYSCRESIKSIILKEGVTSIGDCAFEDCDSLTDVYITDMTTWYNIDFNGGCSNPLYYAKNLYLNGNIVTDLIIPDGVTEIKAYIFYNYTKLVSISIPDSVTSVGGYAFYGCSSLTSISIPDSVTSIGIGAFHYCSGLTGVYITDIAAWCNIDFDESFVNITNPLGYAENLYLNGELVTDLVIPNGISAIKNYTFSGCSSLTSVTIPNSVTSIGNRAFSGCSGLTSITIPDGVTSIGNYTFYYCSSLTSVTIPSSVTSVGACAFSDCTGLTKINWNAKKIADYAYGASGVFCNAGKDGDGVDLVFGNEVEYIPANLFGFAHSIDRCKIVSVTMGKNVTGIGKNAFDECYSSIRGVYITDMAAWCNIDFYDAVSNPAYYLGNLYLNGKLVKDLIIPDGISTIKNYTFYRCGFNSITIPDSVTSIGDSAFYSCYNSVYYHGTEEEWNNNVKIGDSNELLYNSAKRIYFAYVTFLGEYKNTDNVKKHPLNSCINIADFEKKTGYTLHFYIDEECTKEFDISTPITEDTTLYLKYVVNQYTYKFLDEDNKVLKEATVDYGTTITPPETPADKEPYTFDYWDGYTDGMILSDDVEFKAVYKYKDYKITADGLENPTVVTYNSIFNIEPQKIDDYHYFIGYFTESDGKGRQITNEKGESLKAYDVVGDLTIYPHFYSGYMNKVELQGVSTAMPGDTIKQNTIFATDKEAMYVTATIQYPEYLNFQSISGGDFAEASKDSETLKDGYKYLDITCLYDYNGGNMPINQNLIPFEITFEVATNAPIENANISIENVTLIGNVNYNCKNGVK